MVSNWRSKSAVAGSTFLLWALVAGSAVVWGLRFSARPSVLPPPAAMATPAPVDPLSVARLLGSSPVASATAAPALSSRFSLQGVVADGTHGGAALIAIDGKPPKPFRVGATVDENLVLQSVEPRRALLGPPQGPATVTLDLPRPNPAATAALVTPGAPGPVGIPGPAGIPPAAAVPPATGIPPAGPHMAPATAVPPQIQPGGPQVLPGGAQVVPGSLQPQPGTAR